METAIKELAVKLHNMFDGLEVFEYFFNEDEEDFVAFNVSTQDDSRITEFVYPTSDVIGFIENDVIILISHYFA